MKAQKSTPNFALKAAIVQSGQTQRQVAEKMSIPEVRLCRLIRGERAMTRDERRALARLLRKKQSELFPTETEAIAS